MISEIDLRDWDKVDFKEARDNVYRAYDDGQYVAVDELFKFIGQVEAIMKKQVAQKAALFQPAKTGRADIKGLIPQDDGCGWG